MKIQDVETFVKVIKNAPEEEAVAAIKQYRNELAQYHIEKSWDNCRKLIKQVLRKRKTAFQRHVLGLNDFTAQVELLSFSMFFCAIEDEIRELYKHGNKEVRDAVSSINALMYNMLDSKIKIDRRNFGQQEKN